MKCPRCKKIVKSHKPGTPVPPGYPFCSIRCKQVDLGKWFLGEHKISRELEPEEMETEDFEEQDQDLDR